MRCSALRELTRRRTVSHDLNYPAEFFCDNGKNRIDFQTDGEKIAPEIKRFFGFVPAESIVRAFEKHGFSAKAYHGDVDTLK